MRALQLVAIVVLCNQGEALGTNGLRNSFFETFPEDVQASIRAHVPDLLARLNKYEIRHLLKLIHVRTDSQRLRILSRYPTLYKKVIGYAVDCVAKIRRMKSETKKVLETLFLVIPDLVLRPERTETREKTLRFFDDYDNINERDRQVIRELFPNIDTLRNGLSRHYSNFLE
ncbi:unnamed protein product [Bursaphelenchus xylophilus]|uniref:(pine wood nematode) hypothetical protein n=1 Tax=Bursaphelenchus xylophilus TaxID=6326 RepID=A0A1I7RNL9_BURXY|nr:unnamed protein product [Bursaphelenchus xylophilus]CAG9124150.1 unnamed protein product [Bursaphelenchus xylophilus]